MADDSAEELCRVCSDPIEDLAQRIVVNGSPCHHECGNGKFWFQRLMARQGRSETVAECRKNNPEVHDALVFDLLANTKVPPGRQRGASERAKAEQTFTQMKQFLRVYERTTTMLLGKVAYLKWFQHEMGYSLAEAEERWDKEIEDKKDTHPTCLSHLLKPLA